MGKIIFCTRLFLLMWLLFSCGTNNFAKRKYTKGVYVEKRSRGTFTPSKHSLANERSIYPRNSVSQVKNMGSFLDKENNQKFSENDENDIAVNQDIETKEIEEIIERVGYHQKYINEETNTIQKRDSKSYTNSDKSKSTTTGIIFTSIGAVLIAAGIFIMIFLSILFQGFILILGGLVIVIGLIFLIDGLVKLTRPKKE